MTDRHELILNLNRLHTTELGAGRIKGNLELQTGDVLTWCRREITKADRILRRGKNWYVYAGDAVLTVNAHSYTVITAHKVAASELPAIHKPERPRDR